MNVTLRTPVMTRDQFLDWVERKELPYEFDGYEPVAMTGGNRRHSRLCQNLALAVGGRLVDGPCELLPEAGIATVGNSVRYPDALITCTIGPVTDRLIPDPVIVFEVVSPTSNRVDRHIKMREYRAVPSILRYVIIDQSGPDITVFYRVKAADEWSADALTTDETLRLPEAGIDVPVNELFRGVVFDEP